MSLFVAILVNVILLDAILVDAMLVNAMLGNAILIDANLVFRMLSPLFLNVRAQKGERCGSANNN